MKARPTLPALIERFFTERLMRQRNVSPHTIASYRDTFRLLFAFARAQMRKAPSDLDPRTKSREAGRAAKTAAARIAELEDQVARLEKQAAAPSAPAKDGSKPTAPARGKRQRRDIDPGDAMPPGVAVQEPAPLDEAAETALENLEEHLKAE